MDRNNKRWKTIGPVGAHNSCFKRWYWNIDRSRFL